MKRWIVWEIFGISDSFLAKIEGDATKFLLCLFFDAKEGLQTLTV